MSLVLECDFCLNAEPNLRFGAKLPEGWTEIGENHVCSPTCLLAYDKWYAANAEYRAEIEKARASQPNFHIVRPEKPSDDPNETHLGPENQVRWERDK